MFYYCIHLYPFLWCFYIDGAGGVVNVKSVNVTVAALNVIIIHALFGLISMNLATYAIIHISGVYITHMRTHLRFIWHLRQCYLRNRTIVCEWSYVISPCCSIVLSLGIGASWNISMNYKHTRDYLIKNIAIWYRIQVESLIRDLS